MKNRMHVRVLAILAGISALLAGTAVTTTSIANASVSTAAVSNGPIYYSKNPGLGAINPDGTSATAPTFSDGQVPWFSADGTKVAWIGFGMGGVSVLNVADNGGTGSPIVLATAPQFVSYYKPQFSADKSTIYFFSKHNSTNATEILKVDTSTANQTPTTVIASGANTTNIVDISLSKNDDLAYIAKGCTMGAGVFVRPANGPNPTQALSNTCASETCCNYNIFKESLAITWDSESQNIYVLRRDTQTNKNEIHVADKSTGISASPEPIVSGDLAYGFLSIALSPDGLKIAYTTGSAGFAINTVNVDGTNPSGPYLLTGFGSLSWGSGVASGGEDNDSTPDSGSGAGTGSGSSTGGATNAPSNNTTTNNVVPGVTVTDPKVYTEAPKQVASSSAVAVLTPQETKTQKIVSNTPDVCLPNKDDIVFIDEGRCSASILDKKTGEVLRRFRTTVVEDEVSELKIGNEVAILAPIYFDGGSTEVNDKGMKRIRGLKSKITAAGSVLVVGHSGIALGDTEENRILSKERATSTVAAMKKVGSKGPFFATGVGGKDPQTTSTSGKDQDKNRRVVIILVP